MEGDASDGKLHGHQTAWYENGQKKGGGEFQFQDGEQLPGWEDWDKVANLLIVFTPQLFPNIS